MPGRQCLPTCQRLAQEKERHRRLSEALTRRPSLLRLGWIARPRVQWRRSPACGPAPGGEAGSLELREGRLSSALFVAAKAPRLT